MKYLLLVLMFATSVSSFAGNCDKRVEKAALVAIGDSRGMSFSVHDIRNIGKLEIEDLLDGTSPKVLTAYYVVLSSDSKTSGVMVTTDRKCRITSKVVVGYN